MCGCYDPALSKSIRHPRSGPSTTARHPKWAFPLRHRTQKWLPLRVLEQTREPPPSSPAAGLRITDTGIMRSKSVKGAFPQNASRNAPDSSAGNTLWCDAAPEIDAGGRHGTQSEVSRFGAIRLDEHLERLRALFATAAHGAGADGRRQFTFFNRVNVACDDTAGPAGGNAGHRA